MTATAVQTPPRPVALPVRPDGIPAALRALDHWLVWRYEFVPRPVKPWTKVPYRAASPERHASSTDPATWGTFAQAMAAYRAGRADGIGVALRADDTVGALDLDDCRHAETGALAAWAQRIVDQFASSTEVSPSGEGLRIFFRGRKPGPKCKRRRADGGVLEVYDGTRGRYLTVTGHHLDGTPTTLEARQAALDALYAEVFPPEAAPAPARTSGAPTLDDEARLARARDAANGDRFAQLYDRGDWQGAGYASQSEADLALCTMLAFWFDRDPEAIDREFRGSALVREKWLEREDYRTTTLTKAIVSCREVYRGNGHARAAGAPGAAPSTAADREAAATPGATREPGDETEAEGLDDLDAAGGAAEPAAPIDPKALRRAAREGPWPDPEPIPDGLPAVLAFDAGRLLPTALAPWVADIADRAQCPPDFVAVTAVVGVASVVGRAVALRPKRHDDWTVVPNLWGLVIGRPGIMKSPAVHEGLRPLARLVAEATEAHAERVKAHTFALATQKAQRAKLERGLKEAVEAGRDPEGLRADFDALELPAPTERRYLVNDSTVEKLGELLNQNPRGLLLYRDELAGLLRTMDRDGHENDRAFYCEAWNGTGSYVYDRIGRGTLTIEAACLSILGGLQPGPLVAYLTEVFGEGASDDGLIQRFQLMVYPDVSPTWRNVDRWPDTAAKNQAFAVFRRLAHVDPVAIGAHVDPDRPDDLPYLRFTPEAQGRFDAWRADLEARLRDEAEHPVILSHLAKYRSLMPSLALLVHLVDAPGGDVGPEAAERAIAWCAYLEQHARRVYHAVVAQAETATRELGVRIRAGALPNPFRTRQVVRHHWSGLTTLEAVEGALDWLVELGWLRREDVPTTGKGGRPTTQYLVNPKVAARRDSSVSAPGARGDAQHAEAAA